MKRLYYICIILLFAGTLFAQSSEITIEECYRQAKENYPLIRQYDLIKQSEAYTLSNASKGYLPQVTVNAKATYQSEVTRIPVNIPGLDIPTLNKDQYQLVAEVNQTLWDGGTIRNAKKVTQAKAESDIRQVETELYTLNDRVNQLYFGILLYNELLKQNTTLQKDLTTNIAKITSMMENGVANQSDLESMTVELLNTRQKEVELQSARHAYIRMLAALTGKEIGTTTTFRLPSVSAQSPGNNDTILSTHNSLHTASDSKVGTVHPVDSIIRRPELQLYEAQENLIDTRSKQLTSATMPRFGLFVQGGFGRPGLNMLDNDFSPFYIGGIRLTWNIGKYYTLKNDRRKLSVGRLSVNVARSTFLFNTHLQLTREKEEIQKMNKLLETDDQIVALRTSIRRSAEVKLENGVISVTDLIREINAEDLAKQTAAQHRIQRLQAIYNYKYTTNN